MSSFYKYFFLCFITFLFSAHVLAWTTGQEVCDPTLNFNYKPTPLTVPNGNVLPYRCIEENGKYIKVFDLTVEPLLQRFNMMVEPGPTYMWGFKGPLDLTASNPGPVIEAFEGERVRIVVHNHLPEATSIHWHGIELPNEMDGSSGHSQAPIGPGKSYTYEFTLEQEGTYMYHSGHMLAKQLALGMSGFFIIHPKKAPPQMDYDVLLFLQMWSLPPHSQILDTMNMMFNFFSINGKAAPATNKIIAEPDKKMRIRFANISMMQHPIHLHGHTWKVVSTGSGRNDPSTFTTGNTVLVPVGQTLDVEMKTAHEKGEWIFHCHLPHHVTNNMEINPVPGEMMSHEAAGMFTSIVVKSPDDPETDERIFSNDGDHGHHMAPLKMGRYLGLLKMNNGRNILASLDLFKVQDGSEWRKLRAILKLYLGEFGSSEYITETYDDVHYDFTKREFNFKDEGKGLTISDAIIMSHGEHIMFKARVVSGFNSLAGQLDLKFEEFNKHNPHHSNSGPEHTNNENPIDVVDDLKGEYLGFCNGSSKKIQIETLRGLNESAQMGTNPFEAYRIVGRIGVHNSRRCGRYSSNDFYCIENVFEMGTYDFFQGTLYLKGNPSDINCTVDSHSIICDSCIYTKHMSESETELTLGMLKSKQKSRQFHLELPKSEHVTQLVRSISKDDSGEDMIDYRPNISGMRGNFYGYLHHETLDRYQPMRLQIVSSSSSPKPMMLSVPFVSATSTLYFGKDKNASEFLTFNFPRRPFLDSTSKMNTDSENTFVFDDHHNTYFVINEWTNDYIKGTWYSKSFGRVGSVELIRGTDLPALDEKAKLINPAAGPFFNDSRAQWKLHLLSRLETNPRDDGHLHNPYYPRSLGGRLGSQRYGNWTPIKTGSYDFYSGGLSILTEDGRLLSGSTTDSGLSLRMNRLETLNLRLPDYNTIEFKSSP